MEDVTFGTNNPLKALIEAGEIPGTPLIGHAENGGESSHQSDVPQFGLSPRSDLDQIDGSQMRPIALTAQRQVSQPSSPSRPDTLGFTFGPGRFQMPVEFATPRMGSVMEESPAVASSNFESIRPTLTPRTHVIATPRKSHETRGNEPVLVGTPRTPYVLPEVHLGVPGDRGKALFFVENGKELILVVDRSEQQSRKKRNMKIMGMMSCLIVMGAIICIVMVVS